MSTTANGWLWAFFCVFLSFFLFMWETFDNTAKLINIFKCLILLITVYIDGYKRYGSYLAYEIPMSASCITLCMSIPSNKGSLAISDLWDSEYLWLHVGRKLMLVFILLVIYCFQTKQNSPEGFSVGLKSVGNCEIRTLIPVTCRLDRLGIAFSSRVFL